MRLYVLKVLLNWLKARILNMPFSTKRSNIVNCIDWLLEEI